MPQRAAAQTETFHPTPTWSPDSFPTTPLLHNFQGRIQGGFEGFIRTPPPWLVSHFAPPRHLWTNIKTNCFSCLGHQLQFAILSTSIVSPGPDVGNRLIGVSQV